MDTAEPIVVKRECEAVLIPSGERIVLSSGSRVWLRQALGGSYTVMTDRGYVARVEAADGDAIGMNEPTGSEVRVGNEPPAGDLTEQVWAQLRTCFDPEIPVNIVDLGLVYSCDVAPCDGGYTANVRFTLTAQGCGMGQFLKRDIENKLRLLPGMRAVEAELVWDPPWNQSMISREAKQQLGIE